MNATLSTDALALATRAVSLLERWDWSRGEPLAALTIASKDLFGEERHSAIVAVTRLEREYGAVANCAESRRAALAAVVRRCGR